MGKAIRAEAITRRFSTLNSNFERPRRAGAGAGAHLRPLFIRSGS